MASEQTQARRVVAVLGAGALGSAMAERLAEVGHEVRLWDRNQQRAEQVAQTNPGVSAFTELADALVGAAVVMTVLRDGEAVIEVMEAALPHVERTAVWVQASTVGPRFAGRLAELARRHGVAYLDAPVSGSTAPAREGKLIWLISGEDDTIERARPVLDALGSKVVKVKGETGASALKVVINAWMVAVTVAMSEVLDLCERLGVDRQDFVRAIEGGPLGMPYAIQKIEMMTSQQYPAGFATSLALKDVDLAADSGGGLGPLLQVVRGRLERTVEAGHGGDDLAAIDAVRGS
ncbi:MAG: garR [Acidimicrobiaceae bacterium]|nr:garR [Acidimicrobiaceae bacterium]